MCVWYERPVQTECVCMHTGLLVVNGFVESLLTGGTF